MDDDGFFEIVQEAAGVGREDAERATRAVLQTLGDRIARGEARDLATQLPPGVSPWLATTTEAEGFDVDEFLRRVAERESVDPVTAERSARAVFAALAAAVSAKEYADMTAELPSDYARLLARGPDVDVVSMDAFLQKVAERGGVGADHARRLTDAVLETLAERIAGGEVEDLMARLPLELHEPLRRGEEHSGGRPTRMSLEDFVGRVAEREGSNPFEAREHVRAVLRTLREAVGDDEFFDVKVQLPQEYAPVLL